MIFLKTLIKYKEIIMDDVLDLPVMDKVEIEMIIHYENKRLFDIDNVTSVVCKFTQDALVELGRLPDDNFNHIVKITSWVGEISKNNAHIEMRIKEI